MLDADALAEYETWKLNKMTGQLDLSVAAFNAEMESQALAYEVGVRDTVKSIGMAPAPGFALVNLMIETNPYRNPGMRGERSASHVSAASRRTISSTPEELPNDELPEEQD